tara:strand:- start:21 stop:473 length:453 start_codon:yes stop_codon:yes gene_type:complete
MEILKFDSGIDQPADKGIVLKDIIEKSYFEKHRRQLVNGCSIVGRKINPITGKRDDNNKDIKTEQYLEVNKDPSKSRCLSTVGKDTLLTDKESGRHLEYSYRKLTPIECERLQTLPDSFTNHVSNTQRYKALGNGWTVDVVSHIFRSMYE